MKNALKHVSSSSSLLGFDYATWYAKYAAVTTAKESFEKIDKALDQATKISIE
jgi:hypothetical protein